VLPAELPVKDPELTHIGLIMDSERLVIPVQTLRTARGYAFLRFQPLDMAMGRKLVRAVMGRADAWQMSAPEQVGELRSLNDIIMVDCDAQAPAAPQLRRTPPHARPAPRTGRRRQGRIAHRRRRQGRG
jgi:hypothetical protein